MSHGEIKYSADKMDQLTVRNREDLKWQDKQRLRHKKNEEISLEKFSTLVSSCYLGFSYWGIVKYPSKRRALVRDLVGTAVPQKTLGITLVGWLVS